MIPSAVAEIEKQVSELHRVNYPEQYKTDREPAEKTAEEKAKEAAEAGKTELAPEEPLPVPTEKKEEIKEKPAIDFEHKFKVLEGKYNAEVPRLHKEIVALKSENETLKAKLSSDPKRTDVNPKDAGEAIEFLKNELGDGFTEKLIQAIEEKVKAELKPHVEKMQQVESTVGKVVENSSSGFLKTMDQEVKDWRKINGNKEFHAFLATFCDPINRVTYQQSLDEASQAYDGEKAVAIFKAWPGYAALEKGKRDLKAEQLEEQVTPGRTQTTVVPTPEQKKIRTGAEIKQFYRDVQTGKYKGREAEQRRIEQEIIAQTR